MKKILLLLFIILSLNSFSQNFEWVKSSGGIASDFGRAITVDSYGNSYITGDFTGTADFDPGPGTTNLTSNGSYDFFIQKLDSNGNLLWAKSIGGTFYEKAQSITIDAAGYIYISGIFGSGTVDFDPGIGIYNVTPMGSHAFIEKLDTGGNFIWVKTIDAAEDMVITTDNANNLYISGGFHGTVDFDPDTSFAAVMNLSSNGLSDIFTLKLNSSGNFLWAKSAGVGSFDISKSVTSDIQNSVFTTGSYSGYVDFDPDTGIYYLPNYGGLHVFIQKLDSGGNLLWANGIGGPSSSEGKCITTDPFGNVYITGYFTGTVDFDPDTGINNITSNGDKDVFIQKYGINGNLIWTKTYGGIGTDRSKSITTDNLGNVYIAGDFLTTTDFDPGPGTFILTPSGWSQNIFLQKLDPYGNLIWAHALGGNTYGSGASSIISNSFNDLWLTGFYKDICDFQPGAGIYNLISNGLSQDVFVLKLSQCQSTNSTDLQIACNSFTWIDGNTYISNNNTATITLTSAAGCDSVVTLDLSINSNSSTDVQTACDSYTWIDGNTYTTSNNTVTHTLTNVNGCDSVVTLDLTINFSDTETDTRIECDALTWIDGNTYTSNNNRAMFTLTNLAGCDSVVTLDLTIKNSSTITDTQATCNSFTWIDGNTYTSSNNTATHTLANAAGCDSIVTLNLTINNSATIDNQIACDSYTWIDGNTYTTSNNTATFTLTNAAGCDSVISLNLTIKNSTTGIDTHETCVSYVWIDGNTYTANNNSATFTTTNAVGCDSIVTLNLTISLVLNTTDSQIACDSYTWIDGNTYTTSNNIATQTLTATAGCDSIVTLDLTIYNSTSNTDTQVACNFYTWIDGNVYTSNNNTATFTVTNAAGCDSVITLDLTINNSSVSTDTQVACDTYTWMDGVTYTSNNNTAIFTLTNAVGCDSVVTLDLTINSIDTTVAQINNTLIANEIGATYQWIDCGNGNVLLSGETNQTYIATANGNYAVIITNNGCSDTSACYTVTGVGIVKNNFKNNLLLYPSPTNGNFSIDLGDQYQSIKITITDIRGRVVQTNSYNKSQLIKLKLEEPAGIYLLKIETPSNKAIIQLIKE